MRLLDDVVDAAIASDAGISTLLRKLLVLAYRLKNDRLKEWIEKELNGYNDDDELPHYRDVIAPARGLFLGPGGAQIPDQPLAAGILDEQHRHFAMSAKLTQPIAAYDSKNFKADTTLSIPWPADLVVRYQSKFLAHYALNRAWQIVPNTVIVALTDTVRNRVLRLALDLREELGLVHDDPAALAPGKVDQYVTNYIYGGTNVIAAAAHHFSQIGEINIGKGDIWGLFAELRKIGIEDDGLAELKDALEGDASEADQKKGSSPGLGRRTSSWLTSIGLRLMKASGEVSIDTAKSAATKAILQYLGLS